MTITDVKMPVVALMLAIGSIVGQVYTEYRGIDRETIQRVTALEVSHVNDHENLVYIRTKVDKMGDDLQKLVLTLIPIR